MYYLEEGIGAVPAVVGVVSQAVSAITGGGAAQRRERNIQDRVKKYQSYPTSQLQDIIRIYGGEMGEAAQRVLASRGVGAAAVPTTPASGGPLLDLSKYVKLPEVTTTSKVEIPPMLLYGGLALGGVLALSMLSRPGRRS